MTPLNRLFTLLVLLALLPCVIGGFVFSQEHEPIVEDVKVSTVVVPVRVFLKDTPVKGLKKENFKLRVNGKETPITTFFEKRQKIFITEKPKTENDSEKQIKRLFVLVFSINDYNMSLTKHLDKLFEKIIRPGDRLMIVSNNFFLTDRVVKNIKKEKQKIKKILEIEALRVKYDLRYVEFELKGLAEDLLTFFWADMGPDYPVLMQDFRAKYREILDRFKKRYHNIIKTQGIRMANYLKDIDARKWVINFYQVGMFPQLKRGRGEQDRGLAAKLEEKAGRHPWMRADLMALNNMFTIAEGNMVKAIGQYYLNSEVTFHTILMKGYSNEFLDYYEYRPIATEAETMMRRLTKLTGGEEMGSNNVDRFIDKISEKEDIYYVLSYDVNYDANYDVNYDANYDANGGKNGGKKSKINVSIDDGTGKNQQEYRLVYDNQKRPWYMKRTLKKIDKKDNPTISLKKISYSKGILSVQIEGIKMLKEKNQKQEKGKIHLTIKILNNESREVTKVQKAFKCKENKFVLRMKPPGLKKGVYDIVAQVTDLLTGKNDVQVERIKN